MCAEAPPMLVNSEYKSFRGQIGNTRSRNEPNKTTLHFKRAEEKSQMNREMKTVNLRNKQKQYQDENGQHMNHFRLRSVNNQ